MESRSIASVHALSKRLISNPESKFPVCSAFPLESIPLTMNAVWLTSILCAYRHVNSTLELTGTNMISGSLAAPFDSRSISSPPYETTKENRISLLTAIINNWEQYQIKSLKYHILYIRYSEKSIFSRIDRKWQEIFMIIQKLWKIQSNSSVGNFQSFFRIKGFRVSSI